MPGMHIEELRQDIRNRVSGIVNPLGIQFEHAVLFNGVPAFFAEENSELLRSAEALTGHAGISVAFGTEGPFLQQLGMDTIIMGPGNIDQAHQPDEYVSMDMLNPTIDVLKQLIVKYCMPR